MATDESRRTLLGYWWTLPVAGTLGAFAYMTQYARRVTFGKVTPGPTAYRGTPRVRVAALSAFRGPYSAVTFTAGGVACVAVELPQATPSSVQVGARHFAAFSRVCTHLGCAVNMIEDTEVLALTFNYRAPHPMLGCPCHFSVFDPLAQGECVFGKALYPLPRVRLHEQGGVLYADGLEPSPDAHTGSAG